jgi:type VI secretion system secreted protein VgrG
MCTSLVAAEGISTLFNFQVECISEHPDQVKLDQLLGKKATVTIVLADGSERFFHGLICRCAQTGRDVGADARFTHYRLELVPWLWLLSRTTDSRIFQDKTIPEIIEKIFSDHQLQDFRKSLTKSYTPLDYCVQYRESDFDFLSRLMEEEGIFYFFEYENGKHTLVLADSPDVHQPCPGKSQVLFEPEIGQGEREDTVAAWREQQELRPGKLTLWDNNFQLPTKTLEVSSPTKIHVGDNDKLELYDFPGGYAQRFSAPDERLGDVEPEGNKLVKTRMEEEEAQHLIISGESSVRGFTAGTRFELESPPPGVTAGPYVLTSVQHTAALGSFVSGDEETELKYSNAFTCIPVAVPFRPRRLTPRPVVQGAQTAVVVGPAGEEIYPDKYGRVKVQFYWDREGKRDEHSSCWVRVSQVHAGKGFGGIDIPRIGEEVVVGFLEGDPDQPIIVGRVYHADNMPPFELPGSKTISGLKSNSTKGGGGYNEYVLDDNKGQELIREHGQYDKDSKIEHDLREHVLNDRSRDVTNNETVKIGVNQALTVDNDRTITVNGKHTETIKSDTTIKVTQGTLTHYVKGDVKQDYDATQKTTVAKDIEITSKSTCVHVTAATEIHLKVGSSELLLKSDGSIQIKGANIAIEGSQSVNIHGMSVTSQADADHNTRGAIVLSEGSGTNTVKGGMVMLNP